MSLDVYLESDEPVIVPQGSGIFIRENGQTIEMSPEEYDCIYPGRVPCKVRGQAAETTTLYHSNITHNLLDMAGAAGIYPVLWRPDEYGYVKAKQLIAPLRTGLETLRDNPEVYKKYNPKNGWGSYETLVSFVDKYLQACIKYPKATIRVSR